MRVVQRGKHDWRILEIPGELDGEDVFDSDAYQTKDEAESDRDAMQKCFDEMERDDPSWWSVDSPLGRRTGGLTR